VQIGHTELAILVPREGPPAGVNLEGPVGNYTGGPRDGRPPWGVSREEPAQGVPQEGSNKGGPQGGDKWWFREGDTQRGVHHVGSTDGGPLSG
jgi:hypothetical protein